MCVVSVYEVSVCCKCVRYVCVCVVSVYEVSMCCMCVRCVAVKCWHEHV